MYADGSAGYVHRGHLDAIVKEASAHLGPEVLHVAYRIRPDSTDEPSIFFRILLADSAVREDIIVDVTRRIADVLLATVRPVRRLGLASLLQLQDQIRAGSPERS
jgi:hypothetical protein